MKPPPLRTRPHRTGTPPRADLSAPCQPVRIPCSPATRARLEALRERRADSGGSDVGIPPGILSLSAEESRFLSALRRLSFQEGEAPHPGAIGPAPWYLTLRDAGEYQADRLKRRRGEAARLRALQESGEFVRPPRMTAADCIAAGLALDPHPLPQLTDYVLESVPVALIRAAGEHGEGRSLAAFRAALLQLAPSHGVRPEEVAELVALVQAWPALPPPREEVVQRLAAALAAGIPLVEADDAARAPRGGLAPRLPPADAWTCATWDRLRAQGREVPPVPW